MKAMRAIFLAFAVTAAALPGPSTASEQATTLPDRKSFEGRVNGGMWFMWQMGDFNTIEKWAAEMRDPEIMRRHSRTWSADFYPSFWGPLTLERLENIKHSWLQTNEEWRLKYPQSITRHFVEIAMYMQVANTYRGDHYIHATDMKNLEIAYDYYEKAYELLTRYESRLKEDPAFYIYMLDLESRLGMDQEKMLRRVFEGYERFPGIYRLPVHGLRRLLPKWGGSIEMMNGYMEAMFKVTPAEERYELYARFFEGIRDEYEYYNLPFIDTEHYRRLLTGYRAMYKRVPVNADYLVIAELACQARDPKMLEEFEYLAGDIKIPKEEAAFAKHCDYASMDKNFSKEPLPLPRID